MIGGRRRRREVGLAVLLLLPSLIIFGVFVFYPLVRSFSLGSGHYGDVLSSRDFIDSLKTTVGFAFLTVPVGIALGLGLAVLAHQQLRGSAVYRTIFSSTVVTSIAVAAVIFGALFNPAVGLLPWIGIHPKPPLLEDPDLALVGLAILTIWQTLGITFILMAAGLRAIPDELNEAATMDGAGPYRRFWRVTMPLLSPTIFFAVVVGSIFAFQTFGQVDILTQGGPLKHTNVLTYFLFTTLRRGDDGKAAVLAVALFAITFVFTALQVRVLEKRVHYGR